MIRIRKSIVYTVLLIVFLIAPGLELFEHDTTVYLAKTLYKMGEDESYETLIELGTIAMNRAADSRYPSELLHVLNEPGAFHRGALYDDRSFQAAREVLMGKRAFDPEVVYFADTPTGYVFWGD